MQVCPECGSEETDYTAETRCVNHTTEFTGKWEMICLECQHHWIVDDIPEEN